MAKYSNKYWADEIRRADTDRDAKGFEKNAENSIKNYEGTKSIEGIDSHTSTRTRRINLWWSIVQTFVPAYYFETPRVEGQLRSRGADSLSNLALQVNERASQYVISEEVDFDNAAYSAIHQGLLTGQGVLWVRYESDVEETEEGEPVRKLSEQAILDSVHWRDFLVSCARNEQEICWKARRAFLSKDDVKARFGSKALKSVEFNVVPEDLKDMRRGESAFMDGKAEFWEIWCEESSKVYWQSGKGDKELFESADPPLRFDTFYPCSEWKLNYTPNSVVPISDHFLIRDQLLECERLTHRIHAMAEGIRVNFAYNAAVGTKVEELMRGDLKFTPIQHWPQELREKGGSLSAIVQATDIAPQVQALQVLIEARNEALNKIYEQIGMSDLVRGFSDAEKTATANKLESNYYGLRFRLRQKQCHKMLSDAITKTSEVVCEHYSDEKLFEISNAAELLAPYGPNGPQVWQTVLGLLRSDERRRFKIEIASDSMVALDEAKEREDRTMLMSSAGGFFSQMQPVVENYPSMVPLALKMMEYVVGSYKTGKEMQQTFQDSLKAIAQEAQMKQSQQAQAAQAPNDAAVKMQVAQIEAQQKQMQIQAEMQIKGAELQGEREKQMIENETKRQELLVKLETLNVERDRLRVEVAKIQGERALDLIKVEQEDKKIRADLQKELIDTEQEKIKAAGKIASDLAREAIKSEQAKSLLPKPRRRRGKITRDSSGNAVIEVEEIDDEPKPKGKKLGGAIKRDESGNALFEMEELM
jgi:hypothetical protein